MEEFQRKQGQLGAFVDHIKEGVRIAAGDLESLLVFSGGVTRRNAGMYVCVCMCMCVYVYVCVCIYINTHMAS